MEEAFSFPFSNVNVDKNDKPDGESSSLNDMTVILLNFRQITSFIGQDCRIVLDDCVKAFVPIHFIGATASCFSDKKFLLVH